VTGHHRHAKSVSTPRRPGLAHLALFCQIAFFRRPGTGCPGQTPVASFCKSTNSMLRPSAARPAWAGVQSDEYRPLGSFCKVPFCKKDTPSQRTFPPVAPFCKNTFRPTTL